jgi:hypothetical protein
MNHSGSYGASELLIKAGADLTAQDTSFGDQRLVHAAIMFSRYATLSDLKVLLNCACILLQNTTS